MEKDIKLAPLDYCTGCGACLKICPQSAIFLVLDEAGFPTPKINNDICIKCGLCERTCPVLHEPPKHKILSAYAAQIKDSDALINSTSGGIFTALSREVFRSKGVVYGCVWDENYNAVVKKAETEDEIKPMRGSKYVWSWAGDTFPEIKSYLENGRSVLFSGLPCQVAGLKNYLRKDYDNLILVDFLCSGSPSPLAFNSYLDTICNKGERKSLDLKFRDKDPYGVGVHITYKGKKKKIKRGEHIRNSYYWSFYTRLIDRLSCYNCPYGSGDRVSDVTLADYWGISKFHSEFDVKAGVSALLVNSDKGVQLIEKISEDIKLSITSVNNISQANNLFVGDKTRNIHKPKQREAFFSLLKKRGWKVAEKKYLYSFGRIIRIIDVMLPNKISRVIKKIIR